VALSLFLYIEPFLAPRLSLPHPPPSTAVPSPTRPHRPTPPQHPSASKRPLPHPRNQCAPCPHPRSASAHCPPSRRPASPSSRPSTQWHSEALPPPACSACLSVSRGGTRHKGCSSAGAGHARGGCCWRWRWPRWQPSWLSSSGQSTSGNGSASRRTAGCRFTRVWLRYRGGRARGLMARSLRGDVCSGEAGA
jgi:hypothetical protein